MTELKTPVELVDRKLVKWFFIVSIGYLFLALLAGLTFSTQFFRHYIFKDIDFLSPGRVRMIHTSMVAYGFILNAFLGGAFWAMPRLTGVPVHSRRLSWVIFGGLQLAAVLNVFGILGGFAQGIEWGETPKFVDPIVVVTWVLLCINVVPPMIKSREKSMYVTLWYFSAALVWTALTYLMGNYLPEYVVPGPGGAAITGLFIHDLVGLFVTPFGWGLMYYFVPVITKKPIWSHALSLIGFWGLAFFYPLNGVHHFMYSPIPMNVQYGAVVATVAVEIVVTSVVVNFFMSLRGRGDLLRTNMPIRWFYLGMINYFTTCLQCAFQVTLTFQEIIHFTDWVVGHAHLVMFGVFGFWIQGMIMHLWPRLTGKDWWSSKLQGIHFWLVAVGLLIMFVDLMTAGLIQGFMWKSLAPWEDTIVVSIPFWITRTFSGLMIFAGVCCMIINMIATVLQEKRSAASVPAQA